MIEVLRVETLYPHETVLTARAEAFAIGMNGNRVDRTEMALDASELFLEYQVEKARLELALTRVRGCDVHRFLTTAENDVLADW